MSRSFSDQRLFIISLDTIFIFYIRRDPRKHKCAPAQIAKWRHQSDVRLLPGGGLRVSRPRVLNTRDEKLRASYTDTHVRVSPLSRMSVVGRDSFFTPKLKKKMTQQRCCACAPSSCVPDAAPIYIGFVSFIIVKSLLLFFSLLHMYIYIYIHNTYADIVLPV